MLHVTQNYINLHIRITQLLHINLGADRNACVAGRCWDWSSDDCRWKWCIRDVWDAVACWRASAATGTTERRPPSSTMSRGPTSADGPGRVAVTGTTADEWESRWWRENRTKSSEEWEEATSIECMTKSHRRLRRLIALGCHNSHTTRTKWVSRRTAREFFL